MFGTNQKELIYKGQVYQNINIMMAMLFAQGVSKQEFKKFLKDFGTPEDQIDYWVKKYANEDLKQQ